MSSYDPDRVKPEPKEEEEDAPLEESETSSSGQSSAKPEPVSSDDEPVAKPLEVRSPVPEHVSSASVTPPQDESNDEEMPQAEDKVVVRPQLVSKTIANGRDGFFHKAVSLNTLAPIEFKKEADLIHLEGYAGFVKSVLEAFSTGRSIVVSSDDVDAKASIFHHCILAYNTQEKPVVIVVRNVDIARRRIVELSNEAQNFSMLPALGEVYVGSLCYIATIDSFRMQVLRQPETFSRGLVIFEDVEEIQRPDKGYLWEETLVNLPHVGQFIFSLPFVTNAESFTEWLVHSVKQSMDVVTKASKDVQMRHFLCIEGCVDDSMMQVVDGNGKFYPERFSKIDPGLKAAEVRRKLHEKDRKRHLLANEKSFVRVVRTLFGTGKHPILVYTTNSDEIEAMANQIKTLNFCDSQELQRIDSLLDAEWKTVPTADQNFARFDHLKFFLQRGVAVYHAGMTPFVLELIDGLLKLGLIKVVISDSTIIDRTNHRFQILIVAEARIQVDPGTSTWMSGAVYRKLVNRIFVPAGSKGISVMVVSTDMSVDEGKAIFDTPPPSLEPDFVPTFNGVLNAVHRNGVYAPQFVPYTFYSYHNVQKIADARKQQMDLYRELGQVDINDELRLYEKTKKNLDDLRTELAEKMYTEKNIKPFINVGRLIWVKFDGKDFGWGIVAYLRRSGVQVLIRVTKESAKSGDRTYFKPYNPANPEDIDLVATKVTYDEIFSLSERRLSIPKDLRKLEARDCVLRHLEKILYNMHDEIPELTPVHLKESDRSILVTYTKKKKAVENLQFHVSSIKKLLPRLAQRDKIQAKIDSLQAVIDADLYNDTNDEWQLRYNVLKKIEYIDESAKLTPRGLFAAQLIGIADAVVITFTELLHTDFFNDLRRDEIAMVFSVFTPMEAKQPPENMEYGTNHHKELFNNLKDIIQKGLRKLKHDGWTTLVVDDVMKQVNPTMFAFLYYFVSRNDNFAYAAETKRDVLLYEGYYATYIQRIDRLIGQVMKYGAELDIVDKEKLTLFQDTRKHLHRGLPIMNLLGSIMTDLY